MATERLSHGRTAVGVKLLAGNHQSYDVDAGCDPAVVRVLQRRKKYFSNSFHFYVNNIR